MISEIAICSAKSGIDISDFKKAVFERLYLVAHCAKENITFLP